MIVDLSNLDLAIVAQESGSDIAFLDQVVSRKLYPYSQAIIPKRTGGERILDIPLSELMAVQSWILVNILEHSKPHAASFAYTKGRSVRQCAEQHLGARWLLRMDLTSFFPSIDERSVYYLMLKEFSASKLLSFQLARLLTIASYDENNKVYESEYRRRYVAG